MIRGDFRWLGLSRAIITDGQSVVNENDFQRWLSLDSPKCPTNFRFVDRNDKLEPVGHLRSDAGAARSLLLPGHGGIIICLLGEWAWPTLFLGDND